MSDPLTALKYDALARNLERVRGMESGYFAKFFSWITLTGFTFVILYLIPYPPAQLLLPFWVLTAGVQASFYLHFVDYARARVGAIEARINLLLGETVMVGAQMEDGYFYPIGKAKFSGIIFAKPSTFFSAYTVHWLFIWSFFFLVGVLAAWESLTVYRLFYMVLLASWSALNLGYLGWYFVRQEDLTALRKQLHQAYGLEEKGD